MEKILMGRYDDIINMEHHTSKRHPKMPLSDRAAQFAPFAALTGYEDMIERTGAEGIPGQAGYDEGSVGTAYDSDGVWYDDGTAYDSDGDGYDGI
ncbi:MAG: hypothetical protein ACI395_02095 [Candidatus Cryptobacteroides sp.]